MNEVHGNTTFNCPQCPNQYKRPHDLARHVERDHPTPSTSMSTSNELFDLLEEFESFTAPPGSSVSDNTAAPSTSTDNRGMVNASTDNRSLVNTQGNNTNFTNSHPYQTKNSESQTRKTYLPKVHKKVHVGVGTNTKTRDSSTNTEPLIILNPDCIENIGGGFVMATYHTDLQVFLSTNNSTSIKQVKADPTPKPKLILDQKRIARQSSNIRKILKDSIQKKETRVREEIKTLESQITKSPSQGPNLDKLTSKYFPREKDMIKAQKTFAHIIESQPGTSKQTNTSQLTPTNITGYSPNHPEIVLSSSDDSDEDKLTDGIVKDNTFKDRLGYLFGSIK